MPKLTEYPEAQSFDENDILIKDGVNGTKKIKASNAADYMGKNVIMINEQPTEGTKVVVQTTGQEYSLALMSDVNAVDSKTEELKTQLNEIVTFDNENYLHFSADNFVKRSTSADPTSVTYSDNGMSVSHGSANANYGIKFATEQGQTYTIVFDMPTGTSNSVTVVDGETYKSDAIVTITPTESHYTATFTALSSVSSLWISFSYSVPTITIDNAFVYISGAEPWIPTGLNPDMLPEDVTMIDEIVDKSYNILALSNNTLKESGDNHISSIIYNDDTCVITKPQANVRFGFTFRPLAGQQYRVSFAASNEYIDNIKVIPGTKYTADDSVLDLTLSEANTASGTFTTTTNEYTIWMRSTYQVGNLTLSSFIVQTTDESSNIKKSKIPVLENYQVPKLGELIHNFAITAKHVFIINGVDGFWLYNHGICECDVPAYEYGLRQNTASPNVMQYADSIPDKMMVFGNVTANGIYNKTIYAYIPQSTNPIGSDTLTVKCATKPSNPATVKNVLFVGDSLIAGNVFPKAFKDMLSDNGITNIALIGRKTDPNDSDVHYEATGGYAWPDFAQDPNDSTVPIPTASGHSNPFWINGELDIKSYCDTYCGGNYPDYVICNLAWNMYVNSSYSQYRSQAGYKDAVKNLIIAFITGVRECNANAKIILNGMHHGCEGKMGIYPSIIYNVGAKEIADIYMEIVNDSTYSSFVEYCDIAPYFDAETGMQTATRTVNQFSEETETYVTDYIHPSAVGYKMHALADMECFLYMIANEA